jgi:hypothetical protein
VVDKPSEQVEELRTNFDQLNVALQCCWPEHPTEGAQQMEYARGALLARSCVSIGCSIEELLPSISVVDFGS